MFYWPSPEMSPDILTVLPVSQRRWSTWTPHAVCFISFKSTGQLCINASQSCTLTPLLFHLSPHWRFHCCDLITLIWSLCSSLRKLWHSPTAQFIAYWHSSTVSVNEVISALHWVSRSLSLNVSDVIRGFVPQTLTDMTGLIVWLLQESRLTVRGQIITYCSAGLWHV